MATKAKPYWRTWPRTPKLPTPRLLAWINHLGTATVARSIVCSENAVRLWKNGARLPSIKNVQELICNSQRQPLPDGKPLTYEDCLGPVVEDRSELRNKK
jgi:hypothetical protein